MYLIVGLGNPGTEYAHTRHNVGFDAVDELAARCGTSIRQKKFQGVYSTSFVGDHKVCLLKPQTFMNLSGSSVTSALHFFQLKVDTLIVVHDDLDLRLGQIKIKKGGGHGGHNGLRDITQKLGSPDFLRVRLGIGRPDRGDVVSYVLGRFPQSEASIVDELLYNAAIATETIIKDGAAAAQQVFHS